MGPGGFFFRGYWKIMPCKNQPAKGGPPMQCVTFQQDSTNKVTLANGEASVGLGLTDPNFLWVKSFGIRLVEYAQISMILPFYSYPKSVSKWRCLKKVLIFWRLTTLQVQFAKKLLAPDSNLVKLVPRLEHQKDILTNDCLMLEVDGYCFRHIFKIL